MAKIRGQLKSIWPDRTQYKPYAYNLEMENVWVEIEVADTDIAGTKITEGGTEGIILTLNGFTCLLGNIADALEEMNEIAVKTKQKKIKEANSNLFKDN